ncbi:type III-E CRISPR-associated RpoE-like sigma factor [Desulfocurvibacter africanus]|uniref:RNA polymerase sigma factor, sigma-70 family n=1 Tax=Desulfocurvibacter africanus subsp. africanus str. Walvis Bay TaxID=690850 RepID=F3YUB0_DESAF|nr:type III-E CRISPR-associated RpoE-like sigma factor [Desulfocurvibacter africanus]EGJ48792.1 RNA polymerase sigma factor, sigma-70 family [Desulfocurvibacter africanus subsp. africanus str. Walvis Bay]
MADHPCIEIRARSPECVPCRIRLRDLCDEFGVVLGKIAANLRGRFSHAVSEAARDDLVAEVAEAALRGVEGYEGRRGAAFSSWVWAIYLRKRVDFFRRGEPRSVSLDSLEPWQEPEAEDDKEAQDVAEAVYEAIRLMETSGEAECTRLFQDLYRFLGIGKKQKDLAEHYGLKVNSLNQRISRCRRRLKELMGLA